ncbi:hypothetical protein [Desulfococcus multivorans]|uniref:Uncharacterized protein n=1 Tax=Desulfococcus multivorans DSM 2059 TaxID=1121405 RepID=S7TZ44_DESML|nr:hypothetical protein [Desulfococcus multivorans]AOY57382.1 conserved uncharacterized protein [Desulfococcus multivorans]AQU99826.1 hypothetical protein B2D07_02905 [Desulfococcus multivorans]EPR42010.1 hypothetical protein dsmv_1737 [Desulfococcus multivorans DSM 2059]SKA10204.1 hypothetical protein SAMN02745446_02779 [Desulfococcus multivorans DSM 2059]
MLIYDDIYSWEGWGGRLKLGSGQCRLRIFDLDKDGGRRIAHLKPIIVVVSDIPREPSWTPNQMSVKSCASHIATKVVREFGIDPERMVWVEYYEAPSKDENLRYPGSDRFDEAVFVWREEGALQGGWKPLSPALTDLVRKLLADAADLTEREA